jgi:hypothetical protein
VSVLVRGERPQDAEFRRRGRLRGHRRDYPPAAGGAQSPYYGARHRLVTDL